MAMSVPYTTSNLNAPPASAADVDAASTCLVAAIRASTSRESSGSSVRVRMCSTLRAPLSTSVQRALIASISAGRRR